LILLPDNLFNKNPVKTEQLFYQNPFFAYFVYFVVLFFVTLCELHFICNFLPMTVLNPETDVTAKLTVVFDGSFDILSRRQ